MNKKLVISLHKMIKLIFWLAAALLPYVESRLLGSFNDEFHPEDAMVDAQMDWNDDFHMDPAPPLQLVCNYMACEDLNPDERLLNVSWNDDFHPDISQSFCPTEIDLGEEGILCLIPTPEPE